MSTVFLGNAQEDFLTASLLGVENVSLVLPETNPIDLSFPNLYRSDPNYTPPTFLHLKQLEQPSIGLFHDSQIHDLPLQPWKVHRLFDPSKRKNAALTWASARVMAMSSSLTGMGMEERSYSDWICRRMGALAYESLYEPYARLRWGAEGSQLSASLARWHHHLRPSGALWRHESGSKGLFQDALARFSTVGTVINARALALRLTKRAVAAIETDQGDIAVDGPLFCSWSPQEICRLLGDALPMTIQIDSQSLPMSNLIQATVRGEFDQFPADVHFLATDFCYRGFFTDDSGVFEFGPATDDQAIRDFFKRFSALWKVNLESLEIRRISDCMPQWLQLSHIRLRRVLSYFKSIGIVPIGRMGLFAHQDPLEAACHAVNIVQNTEKGYVRNNIEPPVFIRDLDARITRFVTR